MIISKKFLTLASLIVFTSAFAEAEDSPAPETVTIQNIEFEVSNSSGGWISLGSEQSPEYLKSVSLKYKAGSASGLNEETLRASVKEAAEEKCRLMGSSDRPSELSSTATLRVSADISSQQVFLANEKFTGKYTCALILKP